MHTTKSVKTLSSDLEKKWGVKWWWNSYMHGLAFRAVSCIWKIENLFPPPGSLPLHFASFSAQDWLWLPRLQGFLAGKVVKSASLTLLQAEEETEIGLPSSWTRLWSLEHWVREECHFNLCQPCFRQKNESWLVVSRKIFQVGSSQRCQMGEL